MLLADTNVLFSFAVDNDWSARARELGVKLVTEDVRLRRAAPSLTQSIDQALSA